MKKPALFGILVVAFAAVYFFLKINRFEDTAIDGEVSSLSSKEEMMDALTDASSSTKQPVQNATTELHEQDYTEDTETLEQSPEALKQKMFTGLKNKYAIGEETKQKPLWQMRTLDDLRGVFQEKYGDNWLAELNEFLRYAFPELADQLMEKMNAYLDYERWTEEASNFSYDSPEARENALWDKRYELFGEDAESIWKEEYQERLTNQGLKQLEYAGSFAEQRYQYHELLREVYTHDNSAGNPGVQITRATRLLDLEGVQDNLHQLTPQEQMAELRELRKGMGMDEAALERMETLDQQRAEMWEKGKLYEEQSRVLEESLPPEQASQQLHELRVDIFGEADAEIIRNEEEANYYRFQERQKIGVN